jgi:hypothetical protein
MYITPANVLAAVAYSHDHQDHLTSAARTSGYGVS